MKQVSQIGGSKRPAFFYVHTNVHTERVRALIFVNIEVLNFVHRFLQAGPSGGMSRLRVKFSFGKRIMYGH